MSNVPPPSTAIMEAANTLYNYLVTYLQQHPPSQIAATKMTAVPEQDLRAYWHEGAVYVMVNPFAQWVLTNYGFSDQTPLFGEAIRFIGGIDGEVASSAPGKMVHVWKMPATGVYAMTRQTLQIGPLH